MATIQGIYIALFGRPADPLGLAFFEAETNGGADLTAIGDLAAEDEYQLRFEGMTDAQIVNSIYLSLFNRDADLAGLTIFVEGLQSGAFTINDIAIRIYDGAQGTDLEILQNKEAAANQFTEALDTTAEILDYQGDAAADAGRDFLDGVTADDATIPTEAETEAAVAALADLPDAGGEIITLTDSTNVITGGADVVEGTANADTIRALSTESLDAGDIIDGLGGNDTLTIDADGVADGSAPVIKNVETITNADAGFDLANVTGATRVNSSAAATYTNAALATTFAATAAVTVGVTYADDLGEADTTVNLATDLSATGTATFELGAAAVAGEIENVNLDVADTDGVVTTVTLDTDLDTLETLTITGAGDVAITAVEATLVTLDAGAATGGVDIDLSLSTALETATTGAGDDVVDLAGQDDVTVDVGAGNDALNLNGDEAGLKATVGAGNDTVAFTAVANNIDDADEADFAADIIAVADFNGSEDLLNLGGATVISLTNPQQGDVEDEASLFDAVTKASSFTTAADLAEDAVVFNFSGNTYVYVDADDDGAFGAGDGLIELTGFTGDFDGSNFIA